MPLFEAGISSKVGNDDGGKEPTMGILSRQQPEAIPCINCRNFRRGHRLF